MPEPVIAQPKPFLVTVEGGRTYFWCACGRSWLYGVPWVALISLIYFVRRGRLRTASVESQDTGKG